MSEGGSWTSRRLPSQKQNLRWADSAHGTETGAVHHAGPGVAFRAGRGAGNSTRWASADTPEGGKEELPEIASLVTGCYSSTSPKSTEKCMPRRLLSWTVAYCLQCRPSLGFSLLPTQFYALYTLQIDQGGNLI